MSNDWYFGGSAGAGLEFGETTVGCILPKQTTSGLTQNGTGPIAFCVYEGSTRPTFNLLSVPESGHDHRFIPRSIRLADTSFRPRRCGSGYWPWTGAAESDPNTSAAEGGEIDEEVIP